MQSNLLFYEKRHDNLFLLHYVQSSIIHNNTRKQNIWQAVDQSNYSSVRYVCIFACIWRNKENSNMESL